MLRQQAPKARPGIRHVVIVLTDGNSQEADLTKEAAEDARETGLEVLAIGVGQHVSAEELHNIASERKSVHVDAVVVAVAVTVVVDIVAAAVVVVIFVVAAAAVAVDVDVIFVVVVVVDVLKS